jgi:hypothetical protein
MYKILSNSNDEKGNMEHVESKSNEGAIDSELRDLYRYFDFSFKIQSKTKTSIMATRMEKSKTGIRCIVEKGSFENNHELMAKKYYHRLWFRNGKKEVRHELAMGILEGAFNRDGDLIAGDEEIRFGDLTQEYVVEKGCRQLVYSY